MLFYIKNNQKFSFINYRTNVDIEKVSSPVVRPQSVLGVDKKNNITEINTRSEEVHATNKINTKT